MQSCLATLLIIIVDQNQRTALCCVKDGFIYYADRQDKVNIKRIQNNVGFFLFLECLIA